MKDIEKIIKSGEIIAFPTETVYGLGCDACNHNAVAKIYDIKKRDNKPLSIIVKDIDMAMQYAYFNDIELGLARQYWPGSLTLILKKKPSALADNITPNDTIGIRIPDHPVALDILERVNIPLVATSVNYSGMPPMTYTEIITNFQNDIDMIIPCPHNNASGKSSTVAMVENDKIKILRQGEIFL